MIKLTCPWVESESAALRVALERANSKPLPAIKGDRIRLTGPLPVDFKRSTMRGATHFCLEVDEHGHVFGLMEMEGHSGGGYGGSCIPTPALVALLNLWASQQAAPVAQAQGELF